MKENESVAQGGWGEAVAEAFMSAHGWKIVGRRVRPCRRDRRCEIDLIMRTRDGTGIVFVEVKTHSRRSPYAGRLWRIDRRKKNILLRACSNWILSERWRGNFRFDVIEVYGRRGSTTPPEIDHMENVPLFPPKWRFW